MKLNFKNTAIAASFMLLPMKAAGNNIARDSANTNYLAKTIEHIEKSKANISDFFQKSIDDIHDINKQHQLNFVKMSRPHRNSDVSKTKFTGHPEFLNMFLGGVLKGKGKEFIKAQEKYGIDATFLIGIANLESGKGMSDYARNRNNIAGMRNSKGYMRFSSVDDCIDRMTENLKRNYIDKGYKTIGQIHKKYAESEHWSNRVVGSMTPLYKASGCKIYKFT